MPQRFHFAFRFFGVAWLLVGGHVVAATRLEPLTVGYSNITATYAPVWLAVEEHLGVKHGLDLKAISAGRVRPQQLLATGEVPIVVASGTGTMTSHIVGVKDQVLVATITSKIGTSLFAKAEIKNVEDLKGRTIATGRPAAFLDATVRYVLRSKFNLIPDRDGAVWTADEAARVIAPLLQAAQIVKGVQEGRC